jgi:hypothetical protein
MVSSDGDKICISAFARREKNELRNVSISMDHCAGM